MNKKIKILFIVLIILVFATTTKVAAFLSTSAINISLTSDKTAINNVFDAINNLTELSENAEPSGNCPAGKICEDKPIKCVRSTTLHTEVCKQNTSAYCSESGYIGYGNTITYGNAEYTEGVLNAGDAFNCDVNADGTYDDATERFYYVSDLYIGGEYNVEESYDHDYAVLIYYSNTTVSSGKVVQNNYQTLPYYSNQDNYRGPAGLISNIPKIRAKQWVNIYLKSKTRAIRGESGTTATNYTYSDAAARLITYQELQHACGWGIKYSRSFDTDQCRFLLENTAYANPSYVGGYWLETPQYPNNLYRIWNLNASDRGVFVYYSSEDSTHYGIRPVIEIKKSEMSY